MEAGTGVMWPQPKGWQGWQEPPVAWDGFSLMVPGGIQPAHTLTFDFWPPEL
jgi:hypothetical protein